MLNPKTFPPKPCINPEPFLWPLTIHRYRSDRSHAAASMSLAPHAIDPSQHSRLLSSPTHQKVKASAGCTLPHRQNINCWATRASAQCSGRHLSPPTRRRESCEIPCALIITPISRRPSSSMRLTSSANNRRKQTTTSSSSSTHSLSSGSWELLMPHYLTSTAAPAWLLPAAIVLLTVAVAAAIAAVAWHWHLRWKANQQLQQQPATGGGAPNGSRSLWEDTAHWRRQRGARARQAVHVAEASRILAAYPPGRPLPEWDEQRARRELGKVGVAL